MRRPALIVLLVFVAALTLAGCGISRSESDDATVSPATSPSPSPESSTASPSASPATSPSASPAISPSASPAVAPTASSELRTAVSTYFLRGQFVGTSRRAAGETEPLPEAALRELLVGPTAEERAAGLHTQIPAATRLLGLSIRDDLATVDLSGEFAAGVDPREDRGRLAQIVYTLTQFPDVNGVRIQIEGAPLVFFNARGAARRRPLTRGSFEDVTPAIFVERPAVGDLVDSPLVVSGTANTYEAEFMIRVRDADGASLADRGMTATSGSGTRGVFNEAINMAAASPEFTLEIYEVSAASGLPIHMVKIPLHLAEDGAR